MEQTLALARSIRTSEAWASEAAERRVQQLLRVLRRVARVQQDDAEPVLAAADHSHEAAARFLGVARLQPDRSRVARSDQRVVARQEQLASLDREAQLRLAQPDDSADPRL